MSNSFKILFLVTDQSNSVVYYCHSLLELFRLRDIYHAPDDAKVFRYAVNKSYSGRRFWWDGTWWVEGNGPKSLEFELVTFKALETAYQIVRSMK